MVSIVARADVRTSCLPSTVTLTSNFGVDYVQAGLAGKIFQILETRD